MRPTAVIIGALLVTYIGPEAHGVSFRKNSAPEASG